MPVDPLRVLFMCVANSARSQLAEGIAKAMFGNKMLIESAGSSPSGTIQPWAVKVLDELGIDISENKSKSCSDLPADFVQRLDFVVTLCAEEVCPVMITKARRLHWPIPDPAAAPDEKKSDAFRNARNLIRAKLEQFAVEHQSGSL
ncbi:MAG: arsenate reductase ArsC [Oligoflexales bacterium]